MSGRANRLLKMGSKSHAYRMDIRFMSIMDGDSPPSHHQRQLQDDNPDQKSVRTDEPSLFDGVRTKFGRRQQRSVDKRNNNARVRNAYLKLSMESTMFDQLLNMINQTRHDWASENHAVDKDTADAETTSQKQITSKKQARRQLAIKPRSRNSLHMTYFFAGQVLKDMSGEELQRWNTMVRKCVLDHIYNRHLSDYTLCFESLVTFPPNRLNLVVAVFGPSSALDDLCQQLCELAVKEKKNVQNDANELDCNEGTTALEIAEKEYEFPLLRDLTLKQQKQRERHKSPRWVAHVTLGNLVGGSKDDLQMLNEWLANRKYQGGTLLKSMAEANTVAPLASDETSILESKINVLGIQLGGPVPEQGVAIDWNFPFQPDCEDR